MARCCLPPRREVGAPVGAVLEGGYALDALARSVLSTMAVLGGVPVTAPSHGVSPLAAAARERLRRWWTL